MIELCINHFMMCNTETRGDDQLIKGVINGDITLFSSLIDRYDSYVFQIVLKVLPNRELAEEVTQDVFLKVYKNIHRFEFKSKFSTWLYRVAYTTAISANRKKSKLLLVDNFEQVYSNTVYNLDWNNDGGEISELRAIFRKAITELSELDGLVISLYYINEQSVDDICLILNIKKSAVKTRLHRARIKLKKLLTIKTMK